MNKREAGLVARAVAIIDAGDIEAAAGLLRSLSGATREFKRINAKRSKPRRGRVIDKPYKAFIASLPCLICFLRSWKNWFDSGDVYVFGVTVRRSPAEVAHVGIRGLGQKSSDRETVPLCKEHHTEGKESERALGKRFWSFHGLDKAEVIKALNAEYERRAA